MDHAPRAPLSQLLHWSGHTDRGKVRQNNEDSFLGQQFDAHEVHHLGSTGEAPTGTSDFVFAVSDGMGGAMAGEFASRITVEKITRLLPRSFQQSAVGLEAGFTDVLVELFDQIHRALTFVGNSYEECAGMQATLSMCWFTPGWMHFGHIGDSRIYYLPVSGGGLRQLSHDDTHVGWLFRSGQINERQAREHPRRTALQKALGAGNQFVEPQVGSVAYEPGDLFLLCTDGLVEGLYDAQIGELLRPPAMASRPASARELVDRAVEISGRDNTTALVVEVLQ
jgi:serine/threonine protein phosphatase PrpC